MKYKSILLILILAVLIACEPKKDDFSPSKGDADFTTYLAIGNSLTAGYTDGALYTSGQKYSFPNILATQLKTVGMQGEFKQPLINTENGVGVLNTAAGPYFVTKFILNYSTDCNGVTSVGPVRAVLNPDQGDLAIELTTSVASQGPFNNIGIPSLKSTTILYPGYGTLNPYYGRFAENPSTDAVIGEIGKIDYTFFTLWLGSNDVLLYAVSGGADDVITPMAGDPGLGFAASMDAVITDLSTYGAKGAIANIPDIMSAPYFTFMQTQIPYNGLVLTRQGQVDSLNAAYQQFGITFSLGQNPFVVQDATSGYPRQMKENDIFLLSLPTDSLKCFGFGSSIPIPHKYMLDATEMDNINTAVAKFNEKIEDLAIDHSIAFVDVNSYLDELKAGLDFDGIHFTSEFVSGNAFSLDGIHLTPQGNAIIANYFIDNINSYYNASIPKVSIADFPNVPFP